MTKTVVVLRALGLGDLLTAVPALKALRRTCPHHRLVLLAPAEHRQLVGPDLVDEVLDVRGLDDGPLPAETHGADVAVNLHGKGPQSHELLLAARPQRLVGFTGPGVPYGPRWRPGEHEVHRWCRMLTGHGIPAEPRDLALHGIEPDPRTAGATLVHPGAKDGARRWPADRWAQVARSEVRAGRRVLVTGGPDEVGLARDVAGLAGLGDDAVLAGRTSLAELAGLVAGAARVACGDTGMAHLATATGTPSVVLFGPTPPAEWGPPAELGDRHVALWAGERGDPHGTAPHPGLLRLRPREVVAALAGLPEVAQQPRSVAIR